MIAAAVVFLIVNVTALAICADSKRREHSFDAHVEQAVAIVDDGKALVREVEQFLRRRHA